MLLFVFFTQKSITFYNIKPRLSSTHQSNSSLLCLCRDLAPFYFPRVLSCGPLCHVTVFPLTPPELISPLTEFPHDPLTIHCRWGDIGHVHPSFCHFFLLSGVRHNPSLLCRTEGKFTQLDHGVHHRTWLVVRKCNEKCQRTPGRWSAAASACEVGLLRPSLWRYKADDSSHTTTEGLPGAATLFIYYTQSNKRIK